MTTYHNWSREKPIPTFLLAADRVAACVADCVTGFAVTVISAMAFRVLA
jgi:hypothetical protein